MAYAAHMALQINFAVPGGELASCTLRFNDDGFPLTQTQMQNAADGAREAVATWAASTGARLSTGVSLTTVLLRRLGDGGVSIAAAESASAGPTAGSGVVVMPNEVAVVVSLYTLTPTRSGRGRIYSPSLAISMGTGGKFATAQRDSILTAVVSMIQAVSTALAAALGGTASDWYPIVASRVDGINRQVVSVRVGDVCDVQRRRQYDLPESYAVAAI